MEKKNRKGVFSQVMALVMVLLLTVTMMPATAFAEEANTAPSEITIVCESANSINETTLLAKDGDVFQFKALDQNGAETPVTWSTSSSWVGAMDAETGVLTTTTRFSCGGTSSASIKAVSKLDGNISKETGFSLAGYTVSQWNKTPTVALSEDGQTAKTLSLSGGYTGRTLWTYDIKGGIAVLSPDQNLGDKKSSIKFNALRPGAFHATYRLEGMDESMTETIPFTITGVAVEDETEKQGKTYLTRTAGEPNPTVQLTAYAAEDRQIVTWESSDETIATVDERGLVTAQGIGSVIINATDDGGAKGGIKVVVQDGETPYFENLQFLAYPIKDYSKNYRFLPTKTAYELEINSYSTSSLTVQNTTLYDEAKYRATASYVDVNGQEQQISVKSGGATILPNIPFGTSTMTITLEAQADSTKKTVYTFQITRPRDTTKTLKNTTGMVLAPKDRALLPTKYQGVGEGVMARTDEDGNPTGTTGVSGSHYNYRCYGLGGLEGFALGLTGNTAYTHLRYSADDGATWKDLTQGGGNTEIIDFAPKTGDKNSVIKVIIQVLDDKTYSDNMAAGKDGFADSTPTTYTVWVEQVGADPAAAQLTGAHLDGYDWYPAEFDPAIYSYTIVTPKGVTEAEMTYKAADGATVKLGAAEQIADGEGVYTLSLKTSSQTLTVTSADGSMSNSYSFALMEKSKMDVPDRVTDYLCVNSQYTNGGFGTAPWGTLKGSVASLGNFGGYITYYYENPLKDNPNNKYGMDFYVYGNANVDSSTTTGMSFFEPGQVWVSEDGTAWYALAGSAHYDKGVDWNYTVNYRKLPSGRTSWTDNHGNSNPGTSYAGPYPDAKVYTMNGLAAKGEITISGICLPAATGNLAELGAATDAYAVNWGYADVFANGTMGADVNPYLDNSNHKLNANGFDLAWAVDAAGNPVDVSDKEFHYVKVQTASNIWHASFGEKSTEVTAVVRTNPQEKAVGVTKMPAGIVITDGTKTKTVKLNAGQQIYDVDLGDMKYVSIGVNGCDENDNIYVNNQRIDAGQMAEGIKVVKEDGKRLVRVLVQSEEQEPVIYLLRLTSSASKGSELIEGLKLDVQGDVRPAKTTDGAAYTASVGYRIEKAAILPVVDAGVKLTINGKALKESYPLSEGVNTFTIMAEKDGKQENVILVITKETAPAKTGKITVFFTLLGDEKHSGEGDIHTLKNGGLTPWISRTAVEVETPATALDVFEKALEGKYTFTNSGGNYISEINGLKEFDNGKLSGWMYTLNGQYGSLGVAEQPVKEGSEIVFHYTDDYTQEHGMDQWNEAGDVKKDEKDDFAKEDVLKFLDSLKLKVTTAYTAKGNIKATVDTASSEAKDTPLKEVVKELKAHGYKVKFKFYRSEKRTSGYTLQKTKEGTTYMNNVHFKKGKRYYYRACMLVYDEDGAYVGRTRYMAQCRYGVRTAKKTVK
ncbi:MAG: DUF4430 domain-containing protein [Firmicutes bacterium]|nr:DUF4430 domain-containing protein [Bacillota bacterium]